MSKIEDPLEIVKRDLRALARSWAMRSVGVLLTAKLVAETFGQPGPALDRFLAQVECDLVDARARVDKLREDQT